MTDLYPASICSSLAEYLQELEESGVEGVPVAERPSAEPVQPIIPPGLELPAMPSVQSGAGQSMNLSELRDQIGDCQRCSLGKTRTRLVFGSGNEQARLMFVGEAPGRDEDRQGLPFVGEAGQILTRLITAMGLTREQVYIANLLKCRPPNNRNPHQDEVSTCTPFLQQQLEIIKPELIVALGTFAAQYLLEDKQAISSLRGRFHDFNGIPLMPTFHPAYLLRNRNNKQLYWDVWNDMTQVLDKLGLPVPERGRKGS